jgi:hypothetical protein
MSLSLAIAVLVTLDVALLAFLAWMMSHPRHLTPHVSTRRLADPAQGTERRFVRVTDGDRSTESPVLDLA